MNKKLIVIICAVAAALLAVVIAIVAISGGIRGARPSDDSSIISSGDSSGDASQHTEAPKKDYPKYSESTGKVEEETKAGGEVKVPINITKNPGIVAAQLFIEYDAKSMSFVGYEEGKIFDEYEYNDTNGKLNFVINASDITEDIKSNDTLVVLKFKINDSAKNGNYDISLKENTMFCNSAEEVVTPEIAKSSIIVK